MNSTGWVYIYELSSLDDDGAFFQQSFALSSPVGNNSNFGTGVAIHADSIIVGADGYRK